MFKVYKESCKNCLLSPDRIVSPQRAKQIIQDCTKDQSYFICHKSSTGDEDDGKGICCHIFYKELGHVSQMIRISERLGMVEFVEQPEGEKLPTHIEMNGK